MVPLKVSGPSFHSAMLTGAGEKLAEVLENTKLQEFSIPYVTNVTADYVTTTEPVKRAVKEAGIFFCKMAAEHRASDSRRL